jgi:hypothetical protein
VQSRADIALSELKEEKSALQARIEQQQSTIAQQREQIGVLTQQRRDSEFTNQLVGLLLKAQGGVDYTRDVDEKDSSYEDSMHVTIAGTAKGSGFDRHGTVSFNPNDTVSHEGWKKANRLVSSCLHYLLNGQISEKASEIHQKIEKVKGLLKKELLDSTAKKTIYESLNAASEVIYKYISLEDLPQAR